MVFSDCEDISLLFIEHMFYKFAILRSVKGRKGGGYESLVEVQKEIVLRQFVQGSAARSGFGHKEFYSESAIAPEAAQL